MVSRIRLNSLAFAAFAAIAFCAMSGSVRASDSGLPAPTSQDQLKDTLQNAPAAQPAPPAASPYKDIPQEFIDEASRYYKLCAGTANMYQYYDCKCMATKYLDLRIKGGADYPDDMIKAELEHYCIDATEAAGYEYAQCMRQYNLMPNRSIPPEEYCTCVATTYARMFEDSMAAANSNTFVNLKILAVNRCSDPAEEHKLYPRKDQ